jgi:hypothetical protein
MAGVRTTDIPDTDDQTVLPFPALKEPRPGYVRDTSMVRVADIPDAEPKAVQEDVSGDGYGAVVRTALDVLRTELTAAHERADRAERRAEVVEHRLDEMRAALDAKDEDYRRITVLLADEQTEHRRVVNLLLERIPARRSWWRWRRR